MDSATPGRTGGHICPWWCAYTFDNFLRRLVHDPRALLGPYLSEGMTALDVGSGMGHFSIGMARLVGPRGRVHAVDLQQKMLDVLMSRAAKAGVAGRIVPHLCTRESIGISAPVEFALLFWMAHEVPDPLRLFREVFDVLPPGGRLFIAEPSFHVGREQFDVILDSALKSGFLCLERPYVRFSRAALLARAVSPGQREPDAAEEARDARRGGTPGEEVRTPWK